MARFRKYHAVTGEYEACTWTVNSSNSVPKDRHPNQKGSRERFLSFEMDMELGSKYTAKPTTTSPSCDEFIIRVSYETLGNTASLQVEEAFVASNTPPRREASKKSIPDFQIAAAAI
ncbi:hypothetical protein IAQ61_007708, partial [Plenodomus lingam]|uniref:uncharacterized protein n=1 Tax=Leptosphaeria maculans TaxID=5022 RepID=UPI00332C19D8